MAPCAGVVNNISSAVVVSIGDEVVEVTADGGAELLDYGCSPGDVTVEFATGEMVTVDGPVCPDERIVIADGGVRLNPVP